jgi:hypothetical protein
MTDADRGILPSPATLTVGKYLSGWLTDSVEGKLARASHDAYKRDVHYHIIPSLGRRKLKDLSTTDIRRFYRKKRDEGLSNRSLEYIHTTPRRADRSSLYSRRPALYSRPRILPSSRSTRPSEGASGRPDRSAPMSGASGRGKTAKTCLTGSGPYP